MFGVELAGGESGDDHGDGVLDGIGIVQGVEDVGAEAGADSEDGAARAAGFLVVVAEGAGGERGRLAAAAVGFGVAAEGYSESRVIIDSLRKTLLLSPI